MRRMVRIQEEVAKLLTKIAKREKVRFVVILRLEGDGPDFGDASLSSNCGNHLHEIALLSEGLSVVYLKAAGEGVEHAENN